MNGVLSSVSAVNKIIVWKNEKDWLHHSTTTGLCVYALDQIYHFSSSILIGGSACLTGGLAFTAFQIGFQFFRTDKKEQFLLRIATGIATTAAFGYLASIPIVTTVAFALLGFVISSTFDWLIPTKNSGINTIGLNGGIFEKIRGIFEKIILLFTLTSLGARGGLIYAGVERGVRWFRPVMTTSWANAMYTGAEAFIVVSAATTIFSIFTSLFISDENKEIKTMVSIGLSVSTSCWYMAKYSNIPVVTTISMLALAALPVSLGNKRRDARGAEALRRKII